jgi:uncharacterized protein
VKIGLISDTHGFLDEKVQDHFMTCDEIWHAGDIGDISVANRLAAFKPFKAVFGNIDDKPIQLKFSEDLRFNCEGLNVWMTHIGGTPPNYNPRVRKLLSESTPDIFICGHSHILRVGKDQSRNGMLFLNPGAAGNQGFHAMKTLLRFEIKNKEVKNMEVIELGKRGAI